MTKGLINDGVIEQVTVEAPEPDLSFIPEQHRTRFFNKGELAALTYMFQGRLSKKKIERVMEIGCQNGRTAKVILSNSPNIKTYFGVDVPPGTTLECHVQRTEVPDRAGELAWDEDRFILLLSKNGSANLKGLLPKIDAIFIDGDHSHEAVLRDHALAKTIVKPGGLIIHHDYHDLGTVGVKTALQELAKTEKFYHIAGTWIVYQVVE